MDNEDSKSKKTTFTIYHYDGQLALAFQTDCEKLLDKFKQKEDCKFPTFAKLWKDCCFISIFEGQEYILTIGIFLENCFFIVKKFLFAADFYTQIGAIYILYALFYKQPIHKWIKIRVTRADVDKLQEIVSECKTKAALDVVFIYNKMRLDGAFQYCALQQPLGLERRFLKRQDLSGQEIKSNSTENPLNSFKKLMEEDPSLVELDQTDDEYQKLVAKYREKCDKLFVFPSKVGDEMKRAYSNVFNINLESDEQKRHEEVKKRAMSNMHAIYRAEKQIVTAMSLDAPSTSRK